jgi:3-methylfumaryl-CoA hydratase
MPSQNPVSIDLTSLRSWIGREEAASDVVTPQLVRRFTSTLGLPGEVPSHGEPAPPMLQYCLAPTAAAMTELGPDGHPARGMFVPPVPLPRRMWAGGALQFHGAFRVGDTVRRTTRIADVVMKEGRSGRLCFVTLDHRYETDGRLLLEERQDVVYRDLDTADAKPEKAQQAAPAGENHREIDTTPTLLFRYSALTFNGHRIHYDRSYTVEKEGYPGLVVHGPLQATMLVHLAAKLRGACPASFEFRALSPLFDGDGMTLNASNEGPTMKLWTCKPGGPVAMTGTATWK